MLKAILLFIKTHAVATAITTTVVVGVAVAAPIVVENYNLNKSVEASIGMLAQNDKPQENTDEPLTFKIEKVEISSEGGNMVTNMKGEDAIEMSSEGTSYKIIPSYNKDVSEWTKEEKEEYERVTQEVADMVKADYDANVENEQKIMSEIMAELQKEMSNDWETREFGDAGSVEYSFYASRIKGTILGESIDVSYQQFVDEVAPKIQPKLDSRCAFPRTPDGSFYSEEGMSMEESEKWDATYGFFEFTKKIRVDLVYKNNPDNEPINYDLINAIQNEDYPV